MHSNTLNKKEEKILKLSIVLDLRKRDYVVSTFSLINEINILLLPLIRLVHFLYAEIEFHFYCIAKIFT